MHRRTPDRPQGPPRRWRPGRNPKAAGAGGKASRAPRPAARGQGGPVVLYGWHTVLAALANPARQFHRLLATENAARRLTEEGVALPTAPQLVRPEALAAIAGPEAVHQGLLAQAEPLAAPALAQFEPTGVLLVLDQITDPHNVGAIMRSAAAFAASAVITTIRHSPQAGGVLAKAASGAIEHVPIIAETNLARAIAVLKEKNVFVVGLDAAASADLAALSLTAPLALVLGAEGRGLRQLTRANCDIVARLDLPGAMASLNVSNAAALALYVATRAMAVR